MSTRRRGAAIALVMLLFVCLNVVLYCNLPSAPVNKLWSAFPVPPSSLSSSSLSASSPSPPPTSPFRCPHSPPDRNTPSSLLNDDYCDCPTGVDEPLTSACAHLTAAVPTFPCKLDVPPKILFASRVDDGVCDCCDGSDEGTSATMTRGGTGGGTKCKNTCGFLFWT